MKKFFRFLIVSALTLFAFVTTMGNFKSVKNVDALTLSEGQSLDTVVDTISISDLNYTTNYNGESYSGQSSINQNRNTNATFSYSEGNTNRSMVFKFKIDVADSSRMNFWFNTTGTNTPNMNGKFYLKLGTIIYESKWNGSSWVDSSNDPLTVGMHTVEMGRIAILDSESFATGNYYVYYKIDGETLKEFTNPYTVTDLNPNLYLELSKGSFNKIYDINASYENPQYISVSSLKYGGSLVGDTLDNTKTKKCQYELDSAVTNKSVVFNADAEVHFDNTDQQMSMRLIDPTDTTNWEKEGTSILTTSSVRIMRNKDDGTATGSYAKVDFSQIGLDNLVVGSTYNIEYGRLAVMNGDTFSGKYHVYYKIDGKEIYSVDQAIKSSVAAGGGLFFSHGSATQFSDTVTYETPKQISVNDLKLGGNSIGEVYQLNTASDFTYDNTNHTANYSLVFKAKYQATDTDPANDKQTQFHFTNSGNKWNSASTILLKNTGYVYLGRSSADNANGGYVEKVSAFTPGDESTIEFGRLAKMVGGHFTGQYYEYLKINDDLKIDGTFAMPQEVVVANFVMITTGAKAILKDINPTTYENADVISISDLKRSGSNLNGALTLEQGVYSNGDQMFTYNATAAHKSVILKFRYESTVLTDAESCQIHFNSSRLDEGLFWIRGDNNYIKKVGPNYSSGGKFTSTGLHDMEIGKIYITGGPDAGKYYLYIKVDGALAAEYITASMPDSNAIRFTGKSGNHMYDVDYLPVEVNSSLYIYKWNVENSGMLFTAKFDKQFNTLMDLTEVGFIITAVNNSEEVFKLPGKLVEEGNYYVVKAALTSLAAEHLASGYEAKVYYKLDGVTGELSSDSLVSSLYNELSDLTGVDEAYVAGLNALKGNVLEVELDEDSLTATGAVKSTDDDAIILTGANSLYSAFILNGKEIMNNQELMVGYTTYKVTLGNNTITLDPQAKEMIYGGSEHFHEINAGRDPDMTAANLAPMTTELGLTSVRLDMSFNDLFDLTSDNKLIINWDSVAAHQSVIDELKAHGGVTDFLGVIWTILPYGYKTWDGAPWEGRTAPTDADNYLLWLQINGEAARLAAELFPDVMNFETWNEAEIMNGIDSTMVKITSIVEGEYNELYKRNEMVATVANYTVAEKAQILTDLMYYMNKGIKESNPDAILTTPSLGCAQITSDTRFPVKSVNFLEALYEAIEDNTPVTGFEVADKDPNNYFQVINVHPYITLGLTTSNWKTGMLEFVAMAEAHNDGGTEIWVTEFGFAQNRYKGSYGANDNPTARADMITVLELADEIDALTKFYFYKVHDYLEHEGAEGNDHWGLYTYAGEIKQIGTDVKNYINSSDSE